MNLSPTLAQFFSPAGILSLLKPAEAVKRGTPRVLPAAFYEQGNADPANPVGTQVGFYRTTNNRDAARLSNQGDPSRAVSVPGASFITMTGIGGKENFDITPSTLAALESPIQYQKQMAVMEVSRNINNFYSRFTEMRTQAIHSVLALGAIYANEAGQILASSSGAKFTLSYGVPTANQLTTNGSGSTYNIGDWSSASTDIGAAIRAIVRANLLATGYTLTTINYGINLPGYLAKNTVLSEYFKRNNAVRDAIAIDNEIPEGFLGMKWNPVWKAARTAGDNTALAQFGDTFLSFSPDPSPEWYEVIPCGTPVPANGVASGLITGAPTEGTATANMDIKYGFYSYGHHLIDPYTVRVVAGDYFLPALKVPTTYYYGVCG